MKKLLAALVVSALAIVACQKEYSLENNSDFGSIGAWEFKDSANRLYAGDPIEYYIDDTTDPTQPHMVYNGATQSLNQNISIEIFFPTSVATTGTYSSAAGQVVFNYSLGGGRNFRADGLSGQFSTENIIVNITQISDTTVTGTFSGTALDSTKLVQIKEGKFTYKKRTVVTNPTVSVGSLGATVDSCTGAVLTGTYKKGTAVNASNTVTVTANVTTPGTYTIYTDTLKGLHFYGSGTFSTAGVQTVTIPAVGTPTDSGNVTFRIRYGTSFCTFKVKIDTGSGSIVVPPTGDYFPTTTNSNWSYDLYDQTGSYIDSSYVKSTGTFKTLGSNSYNIFFSPPSDSTFFRKNNGIYYEGIDLDNTGLGAGGVQQTQMLKDNVPVNSTWTDTYNNITLPGVPVPITATITYTITAKAVSATINTFTFPDVIKVRSVYSYGISGFPATSVETLETWFARGTGIIYQKNSDSVSNTFEETKLRRYQVF